MNEGTVNKSWRTTVDHYRPILHRASIDNAVRTPAPRRLLNGDPTLPPANGRHEVKDIAYVHVEGGRIRHDTYPAWMAVGCGLNFNSRDGESFEQGPSVRYGHDVEFPDEGHRMELR